MLSNKSQKLQWAVRAWCSISRFDLLKQNRFWPQCEIYSSNLSVLSINLQLVGQMLMLSFSTLDGEGICFSKGFPKKVRLVRTRTPMRCFFPTPGCNCGVQPATTTLRSLGAPSHSRHTMSCCTMSYCTIPCHAVPWFTYHIIPYCAIPYYSVPCHTIISLPLQNQININASFKQHQDCLQNWKRRKGAN